MDAAREPCMAPRVTSLAEYCRGPAHELDVVTEARGPGLHDGRAPRPSAAAHFLPVPRPPVDGHLIPRPRVQVVHAAPHRRAADAPGPPAGRRPHHRPPWRLRSGQPGDHREGGLLQHSQFWEPGGTSPAALVTALLNGYLDASARIVSRHDGAPSKRRSDATRAVFGVPVPLSGPARRVVAAAIGMRAALEGLQARWGARGAVRDPGLHGDRHRPDGGRQCGLGQACAVHCHWRCRHRGPAREAPWPGARSRHVGHRGDMRPTPASCPRGRPHPGRSARQGRTGGGL